MAGCSLLDDEGGHATVSNMFATTHVLAAASFASLFAPTPAGAAAAFGAGVISHLVLDAVPHWGQVDDDRFLRVARVDGITMIAVTFALLGWLLVTQGPATTFTVAMAMFGGLLFDLDKPVKHFFDADLWPAPMARLLSAIQTERQGLWPVDVMTGLAAASVAVVTLLV